MTDAQREKKIAACRVEPNDNGGFDVTSPSGNTYHVTIQKKLDSNGSMYFIRRCDCPAHGECVHQTVVERYQWKHADSNEEILERFE